MLMSMCKVYDQDGGRMGAIPIVEALTHVLSATVVLNGEAGLLSVAVEPASLYGLLYLRKRLFLIMM